MSLPVRGCYCIRVTIDNDTDIFTMVVIIGHHTCLKNIYTLTDTHIQINCNENTTLSRLYGGIKRKSMGHGGAPFTRFVLTRFVLTRFPLTRFHLTRFDLVHKLTILITHENTKLTRFCGGVKRQSMGHWYDCVSLCSKLQNVF